MDSKNKRFYLQILPHFILLVIVLSVLLIYLLLRNNPQINLFYTLISMVVYGSIIIVTMRFLDKLGEQNYYEWLYFLSAGLYVSIIMAILFKLSFAQLLCTKINLGILCNNNSSYVVWFFIIILCINFYFEIIDKHFKEK